MQWGKNQNIFEPAAYNIHVIIISKANINKIRYTLKQITKDVKVQIFYFNITKIGQENSD